MRNERGNGRGRPTKRTSATQEAILASIEKGLPFSLACSRAGVSHEFFIQWRQDDPEFESLVAQACSVSVEHNLEVVRRAAANGDWKAAAWMLERSHPKMFSRPEVQVQLNQQFNVQGQGGWLPDPQALQAARDALEDVKRIQEARRQREKAASIEQGCRHQPPPSEEPVVELERVSPRGRPLSERERQFFSQPGYPGDSRG
jgi:hypothetical protein